MMKIIKNTIITSILIFLLCLQIVYLMLTTRVGVETSLYLAESILPGHLTIGKSSGTLNKEILLQDINYQYHETNVKIKSLTLLWQPLQYLRGKNINIDRLALSEVYAIVKSTDETAGNEVTMDGFFRQLKRLADITLGHATVDKAIIQLDDRIFTFAQLEFSRKNAGQYDFSTLLNKGKITGQYQVQWQPAFTWQLSMMGSGIDPAGFIARQSGAINFKLMSQGEWQGQNKAWTLSVDQLSGTLHGYKLSGSTSILFDRDAWHVNHLNFQLADATLTAQGLLEKPHTNLRWLINIPNLQRVDPAFQGMVRLEGSMLQTGNVLKTGALLQGKRIKTPWFTLNKVNGSLTADANAKIGHLKLYSERVLIGKMQIPAIDINIASAWPENDLLSDFMMDLNNGNVIGGKMTFPAILLVGLHPSQQLAGKINLNITRLANFINTKKLREVDGRLTGVINISGTLKEPKYEADLTLSEGAFFIRELGIRPHHINLKGAMSQGSPLLFEGSFLSGSGIGHLSGEINPFHQAFPLKLHLTGEQLQLVQLKEYNITSSPNVIIVNDGDHFTVTGDLVIPFLEIKTDDIRDAVQLPSEVEFVHRQTERPTFPTQLEMRIRLLLGNHIVVSYKDLHATVGGEIVVTQTLGGSPTGAGVLHIITGSYEVYNQLLDIKEGRLIYLGNLLNNPGLDIRAWKTVDPSQPGTLFRKILGTEDKNAVKVGASIRGTLDNPQIELISEPAMSQDDILAYLAFGFSQNNLTGAGLTVLSAIASGINLSHPNVSDTEDTDNSAGQKNVFKVGMLNSVQALHFRRNIGRRFAIETEASTVETGVDVYYIYQSR